MSVPTDQMVYLYVCGGATRQRDLLACELLFAYLEENLHCLYGTSQMYAYYVFINLRHVITIIREMDKIRTLVHMCH